MPVFIVSHGEPGDGPAQGVYTFVNGVEAALWQARAAAGAGKDVAVMGGASIAGQYLRAGLVDEMSIHLVPVLLGRGNRLFDEVVDAQVALEVIDVVSTAEATHLRYRVNGNAAPG